MKHVLGTDTGDDKEIFFEADETFSTFVYKTKSKKYLIIGSRQHHRRRLIFHHREAHR
ncbi:hypothetical protein ES708_08427 [subsurface metagenome]